MMIRAIAISAIVLCGCVCRVGEEDRPTCFDAVPEYADGQTRYTGFAGGTAVFEADGGALHAFDDDLGHVGSSIGDGVHTARFEGATEVWFWDGENGEAEVLRAEWCYR